MSTGFERDRGEFARGARAIVVLPDQGGGRRDADARLAETAGLALAIGVEVVALTEADDQHAGRRLRVQHGQRLEAALRVAGAARPRERLRQLLAVEEADHRQVGVDRRQVFVDNHDPHRAPVYGLPVSSPAEPGGQGPGPFELERKGSRCPAQ